MKYDKISSHITNWLKEYCTNSGLKGYIVGVSGGIDSAVTSTLCAKTGLKVILVNMPIHQTNDEYIRAKKHIEDLESKFENVTSCEINLTETFDIMVKSLPENVQNDFLSLANTRSRLRMTTLYSVGQTNHLLVAGTGNKIEDFGIGFFTKYGDGGVDISPIADLNKSDVYNLGSYLKVIPEIQNAKPTDGLWNDGRTDEDQIGATYDELEWAMSYINNKMENPTNDRQNEVLNIYKRLNKINKHKMNPIPVCLIPENLK